MIGLCEFEKKALELKERIESHVLHPYLRQYIVSPEIDEDKLLILVSILEQVDLSPHKKDAFIIAIMLMQVALDTHDLVSTTLRNESGMKERQLTVLAGDYYSGLYYRYLAEMSDITIIKRLSEAVKTINEHKVLVYHHDHQHVEELMDSMRIIESALINELIEYSGAAHWKELFIHLLLIKRLQSERQQFINTGHSFVFDALKKIIFAKKKPELSIEQKSHLLHVCNNYIENAEKMLETELEKFPQINACLRKRIIQIIGSQHSRTKTLAEEG